jgi:hypothetical protein
MREPVSRHLEIQRLLAGDSVTAAASARRMQHLGGRYGDESLVALGVYYEGRALVKQARVREGLAMLDEAMLAALWARGRLLPLRAHRPSARGCGG